MSATESARETDVEGAQFLTYKTQDPKYHICNGRLINAATGVPIPENEPVIIFRAKDIHATTVLRNYAEQVEDPEHATAVLDRLRAFEKFKASHPDRMKEPDTVA